MSQINNRKALGPTCILVTILKTTLKILVEPLTFILNQLRTQKRGHSHLYKVLPYIFIINIQHFYYSTSIQYYSIRH